MTHFHYFPTICRFFHQYTSPSKITNAVKQSNIESCLKREEGGLPTKDDASWIAWTAVSTLPPNFIPFRPAHALRVTDWSTYWCSIQMSLGKQGWGGIDLWIGKRVQYYSSKSTVVNTKTHASLPNKCIRTTVFQTKADKTDAVTKN